MMMQLSTFTIHVPGTDLQTLSNSDAYLIKFRVSQDTKRVLRGQLNTLGIRLTSIFPDLEHLAEEASEFRPQDAP